MTVMLMQLRSASLLEPVYQHFCLVLYIKEYYLSLHTISYLLSRC